MGSHGGGSGGGISADGGGPGAGEGDRSEEGCCTGAATVVACSTDTEASDSGLSGGGSTGRFRGRPPALREGPAPATVLFLGLCIVTPLPYLGMVLCACLVHLPGKGAAGCTISV